MQGIRNDSLATREFKASPPFLWKGAIRHVQEPNDTEDNDHATLRKEDNDDNDGDGDDDDNLSLESLSRVQCRESSVEDSKKTIIKPPASEVIQQASNKIVQVFKALAYEDPLIKLCKFYENRGVDNLQEYLYFEGEEGRQKTTSGKLFRAFFQCPLQPSFRVYSCLPLALLIETNGTDDHRHPDYMMEHSLQFFKCTYQLIDGKVYFRTKMAAKKSVALQVLLQVDKQTYGDSCQNLLFHSTGEAFGYLQSVSNYHICGSQSPNAAADMKPTPSLGGTVGKKRQQSRFPEWVHQLYDAGVSPQEFIMTFHESVDKEYERQCHVIWECKPTLLCCTMELKKPIHIRVTGSPSSSKQTARDSALRLFLNQIREKQPKRGRSKKNKIATTKEKLYKCDKQQIQCLYPLPRWARTPFPLAIESQSSQPVYLYELEINDDSGKPFVPGIFKLDQSSANRIGILFAGDIEPTDSTEVSSFSTKCAFLGARRKRQVQVSLKHRTVLDLRLLGEGVRDRVEYLKSFNRTFFADWKDIINNNKLYASTNAQSATAEEDEVELLSQQRTYLFVPLEDSLNSTSDTPRSFDIINWQLVDNVVHCKITHYLRPWRKTSDLLPLLCQKAGPDICPCSLIALACAIVAHIACTTLPIHLEPLGLVPLQEGLSYLAAVLPYVLGFLWIVCYAYLTLVPPHVNVKDVHNRFLIEKYKKDRVFVPSPFRSSFSPMTPLSVTAAKAGIKQSTIQKMVKGFHFDFNGALFKDFFFRTTGHSIQYRREVLFEAASVNKKAKNQTAVLNQVIQPRSQLIFLVPETIFCLPLPRDVAYTAIMAQTFMPRLERQIRLTWYLGTLNRKSLVSFPTQSPTTKNAPRDLLSVRLSKLRKRFSFSELIDQATTIHPAAYQRLEFLGDTVLGYFLALNTISHNFSLALDGDDLDSIISFAGRNVSILGAALRAGLSRLLHLDNFGFVHLCQDRSKLGCARKAVGTVAVPEWKISDVSESILGAAYLGGMALYDDAPVRKLLEAFSLPFPGKNEINCDTIQRPSPWLRVPSSCLRSGYPLHLDQPWQSLLSDIAAKLTSEEPIVKKKLVSGFAKFVKEMDKTSDFNIKAGALKDAQTVLFLSALFDGSPHPRTQADDTIKFLNQDLSNVLYRVALLRDSLSCVGNYALDLMITEELFHRYPEVTAGDLDLLRKCATANEVICYIMYKAHIHKCLFQQGHDIPEEFRSCVLSSDAMGRDIWKKRKGWVLSGGTEQYHRRCRSYHFRGTAFLADGPRYPGIAGGSLYSKGDKDGRIDLGGSIFSFRCIAGAMVFCWGVETMWASLGPFFEEVLLLSPSELRHEYSDVSSTVRANGPGSHTGNCKKLHYTILE